MRAEFEDVLRFWLDRGVDGFRIDVAHGMVKAPGLPDWDGHVSMIEGSDDVEPTDAVTGSGNQGPMFDQDGVHDIYRAWRKVLAEYDGDRALVAEAWVRAARPGSPATCAPTRCTRPSTSPSWPPRWDAPALRTVVDGVATRADDAVGAPTTWVLSNHDVVRHASRLGLAEPGSRPNGIGHGDEQPDEVLGLRRARARRCSCSACPARRTCTRARSSACPTTPRSTTTCARTRRSSGPAAPSAAATAAACRCRGRPTRRASASRRPA